MGLKLPFPKWLANIPIEVWFEGIYTDGDLEENIIFNGKCIQINLSKFLMLKGS